MPVFFASIPYFFIGKVYCTLCAKSIVASSKSMKQHCFGYYKGKKENGTFMESEHSKKAQKRKERDDAAVAPVTGSSIPTAPPTIVVQV